MRIIFILALACASCAAPPRTGVPYEGIVYLPERGICRREPGAVTIRRSDLLNDATALRPGLLIQGELITVDNGVATNRGTATVEKALYWLTNSDRARIRGIITTCAETAERFASVQLWNDSGQKSERFLYLECEPHARI